MVRETAFPHPACFRTRCPDLPSAIHVELEDKSSPRESMLRNVPLKADARTRRARLEMIARHIFVLVSVVGAAACVSPGMPPSPAAGKGTLWGHVRLVPREGVRLTGTGTGSYGDRRYRDVVPVDYSRPGFAVVYLEAFTAAEETVRLEIKDTPFGVQFRTKYAAVGTNGRIVLRNSDEKSHAVSCPTVDVLRRIGPGEELELPASSPGELPIFLPDVPGTEALVFISPGPHAVVSESGWWNLRDLEPGRGRLHAWHPRFPPAVREVEVIANLVQRLDLELRVENMKE